MLFSVPKFLKSLWGGHDPLSRTGVQATMFLSAPIINGAGHPAQTMRMAHSQLLCSKVTSQVLLHFLGLEWAKKRVKYIRVKPWEGSQIPLEGGRSLLHYFHSRPKSSMARHAPSAPCKLGKGSVICGSVFSCRRGN